MIRTLLTNKNFRWIMLAILLLIGAWLLLTTFSDSHQLASSQEDLLDAIESKDWEALRVIIHDDYADQWGNDKERTITLLQNFRKYFLSLNIEMELTTTYEIDDSGEARVTGDVTVNGMGAAADQVRRHLGNVETPFVFEWKQTTPWPWSWKLVRVGNEDLEIPRHMRSGLKP